MKLRADMGKEQTLRAYGLLGSFLCDRENVAKLPYFTAAGFD